MRIGIIGAGHIGSTLALLLTRIGHQVAISNSRGPDTLQDLVAELGDNARAVTAAGAAEFGEVVVVSIPYGRYRELPQTDLTGKIVVDTCNYYPERDGHDPDLDTGRTSSSEKLRDQLSGADVVKAFNAIYWQTLRDRGRSKGHPERLAIPISGGDEDAKAVIAGLIRDMGFDPVDAGFLGVGGRKHQPGTKVYGAELSAEEMSALLHAEERAARSHRPRRTDTERPSPVPAGTGS